MDLIIDINHLNLKNKKKKNEGRWFVGLKKLNF